MSQDAFQREAAWGFRSASEPRWPASLALLSALLFYLALPDKLVYGPKLVVPILEAIALLPLQFAAPVRHVEENRWRRFLSIALIALISLANIGSLILLTDHLIRGGINDAKSLIFSAFLIWMTNIIVFGLWYWELDRGGPGARCAVRHREPDFMFPQMANPDVAPRGWVPSFFDYLYVSFTNASAFSPTDTMPLTEWAKGLMMIQSTTSLLTIGLVAARAVNIIK